MTDQTTKATRFLTMGDLVERWAVSRQTIEDWLRTDPDFPSPYLFSDSRVRKFKEHPDIEKFERSALARGTARWTSRASIRGSARRRRVGE
jgi:hypothetical protein